VFELPDDVELIPLRCRGELLVFVLNHSDVEQQIGLSNGVWRDLIGGAVSDRFIIPKFDVVLLRPEETGLERLVAQQAIVEAAP
jgi:hypothetical protein